MSVGVCTRDFSQSVAIKTSSVGKDDSKDDLTGEVGGVMGIDSSRQEMTEFALAARACTISVETLNWTNSASACFEVMLSSEAGGRSDDCRRRADYKVQGSEQRVLDWLATEGVFTKTLFSDSIIRKEQI